MMRIPAPKRCPGNEAGRHSSCLQRNRGQLSLAPQVSQVELFSALLGTPRSEILGPADRQWGDKQIQMACVSKSSSRTQLDYKYGDGKRPDPSENIMDPLARLRTSETSRAPSRGQWASLCL